MNHQRYQGKDQKQMNQKARDMVHDEASNPSKNQQHSNTQPNEPTHIASNPTKRTINMSLNWLRFKLARAAVSEPRTLGRGCQLDRPLANQHLRSHCVCAGNIKGTNRTWLVGVG
jgi:hypothetical protein